MTRATVALCLLACSRAPATAQSDAGAPPAASATGVNAAPAASAAPANAGPKARASYEGTYTSKAGSLYVPEGAEYKAAQWRGDDAGDGLGDGTFAFAVEPSTGRVEGKGTGALGSVVLAGVMADDGTVSFAIGRADPLDGGFTGAAIGKLAGDTIEGTMRLSRGRADAIREATFTAKRK
jgi:hypothetical protein